jgi:hypothetical protein
MRSLVFTLLVLAACGGKLEDEPTGSSNAQTVPTDCAGACDRFRACAERPFDAAACTRDCQHSLPAPSRAAAFASCVGQLSCDAIDRGLAMDYGPIGACYSHAARTEP